ncbi:MAG: accessory factor UbiK family protein [Gammaproteobacteria bacterium]|nr:accessory factor UbiK family protein [Gammaproteobacteria bacterium]
MIDASIIDDLANKMSQIIPPELKKLHQDFEDQARRILKSQLSQLDLVTRDEFDVQAKVLQKTRAKLESLELQVLELEKLVNPKS